MTTSDSTFVGSIPQIYQDYLVPMIFKDFADDIASRLVQLETGKILEIAAGTGVVTKALADRLPTQVHITATDLNHDMLALAQSIVKDSRIHWQVANALSLPFPDHSFDALVSQFGLMFFPDRHRAYQEARRVLKPHGRFLFNVWDQISENDFPNAVESSLVAQFPKAPPRFLSRTPYHYFQVEKIFSELKAAGFSEISFEAVAFQSMAPSAAFVATAFCRGTPLCNEIDLQSSGSLAQSIVRTSQDLTEKFGPGPIKGRIRGLVFTAV